MTRPPRPRALALTLAALGLVWGTAIALYYARLGLTLTHYDARGHLIVARRIFDSITPGWQQIGAVWLPLPHLLNAIPAQVDFFYRTGVSAVAISVISFAVSLGSIAAIVLSLTGSRAAAVAACIVYALNPNVLYLQATPMTEPLLMALLLASVALLIGWCERAGESSSPSTRLVGIAFALACLTRYEAWPVTATALTLAAWVLFSKGVPLFDAIRRTVRVATFPIAAIAAFMVFSRIVGGAWFADDFFVPENPAEGKPFEAVKEIAWGVRELSGYWLLATALISCGALLVTGLIVRRKALRLLPLALITTAAVPFAAFIDGHPYRIRYMVPLVAIEAVAVGSLAAMWPAGRVIIAAGAIVLAGAELRPLSTQAPMVLEAQWDRPNIAAREPVSRCLAEGYRGESVMASMGSLGHYMQSLSQEGFAIRDFLHEGNGDIWLNALIDPRPYAGWILIEEKAEGGDMLAKIARTRPEFLEGYQRVCEGAGLALYRRDPR